MSTPAPPAAFEGRVVLLGDSHLARLGPGAPDLCAYLPADCSDVVNVAVGGSSCRALAGQAARVGLGEEDVAVVSIGTNDAAPWKQVPLDAFTATLRDLLAVRTVHSWVLLTTPGVVESRLAGVVAGGPDRTNAAMAQHREAAVELFAEAGALVVRSEQTLADLGPEAFSDDGVHLSPTGYGTLLPALGAGVTNCLSSAKGGRCAGSRNA